MRTWVILLLTILGLSFLSSTSVSKYDATLDSRLHIVVQNVTVTIKLVDKLPKVQIVKNKTAIKLATTVRSVSVANVTTAVTAHTISSLSNNTKEIAKLQLNRNTVPICGSSIYYRGIYDGVLDGVQKPHLSWLEYNRTYMRILRENARVSECNILFTITNNTLKPHVAYPTYIKDFVHPSFTIVSIASIDRLFMIPRIIERWLGIYESRQIIYVIYCKSYIERSVAARMIRRENYPSRIKFILFQTNGGCYDFHHFPLNRLRNIGIRSVTTTHYITLDIDAWPSRNMHEQLLNLPLSALRNANNAFILPIFFFTNLFIAGTTCGDIQNCTSQTMKHMPKTKYDLLNCMLNKQCSQRKKNIHTHEYICIDWFFYNSNPLLLINCFSSVSQEPYLLMRHHPQTPLYNELFYDYGGDKQILFMDLLFRKFSIFILTNVFAFDIKHTPSMQSESYSFSRHFNVDTLRIYLQKSFKKYGNRTFPRCHSKMLMYSKVVMQ